MFYMVNNRLYIALTCALLAFACIGLMLTSSASPAYAPAQQNWEDLPQEKKDTLLTILEDKLAAERQLIEKYVEYGILPKEKAEKILERLTERFENAKTEGIFPKKEHR